ncbi:hypothetical protein [Bifidobacterium leontopitheci]|uniref:HTH cro/C1-type domain-containing protein n=1 Tax=Bifidobacterium leontopitheci TaxID=2650774 RepID=A0A6I1GGV1_9BIFI|nr:hypothetical protein [Bifidobacterium leontopitheci]KAB7790894.1 hypothetical protein F7D09_0629 [Bifidobacterium leontopitheci]
MAINSRIDPIPALVRAGDTLAASRTLEGLDRGIRRNRCMYCATDSMSRNRIAALLCRLANGRGWNVAALADHAGLSGDMVRRHLDGSRDIEVADVERYAAAFGYTLTDFAAMCSMVCPITRDCLTYDDYRRMSTSLLVYENGEDSTRPLYVSPAGRGRARVSVGGMERGSIVLESWQLRQIADYADTAGCGVVER